MPKLYPEPIFRVMGDRGLLVEYGDAISPEINLKVRSMAVALDRARVKGIVEIIPAYRSFLILYEPLETDVEELKQSVARVEVGLEDIEIPPPRTIEIPVAYGGKFGPDIEFVAQTHGLSIDEVITIHSGNAYQIYMIAFTPGFSFLGGLPEILHSPRLPTPRAFVPAGSVGIAEKQTGIYAIESPGGWRLIGRTPLKLFQPLAREPFLYSAGDLIRFVPISAEEYNQIASGSA
ncbi:MAG: 5-oxoprolinase subunit PxpB [Deltaproteobacteria bacterium]|nr:5-oxoprolinase subunit PxpB [Deltaproteobacteria bacterium]